MLDFIWMFLIFASILFSLFTGNIGSTANALFEGSSTAINVTLSLLGGMAFWVGITELAIKSGLTKKAEKLLRPIINLLFKQYKGNNEIIEKISLNMTANLLGLGNAATPLGLDAVKSMDKLNKNTDKPSHGIILFVAINTASLQLIPTQMAILRSSYNSIAPFSILPQVWLVSFLTFASIIILCNLCKKRSDRL